MLRYVPDDSLAHRLDPRSKLLFQVGFAVAVFARPTPAWLVGTTLLGVAVLAVSRVSPLRVLESFRYVLVFLAMGPALAGVTLGSPWFRVAPAADSLLLVSRVIPMFFVSAAYVRTTPIRDSRAALQRHLPGRIGQTLGTGVGLVFRTFPLVLEDVTQIRRAVAVRGGEHRSLTTRVRLIVVRSLQLTFQRSDRLSVALQARCFAWNPTLPALRFGRMDYPVLALGVGLAVTPLLPI